MADLREIVASLAGCPPSEVDAGFSLERQGLQGSMRRSVLIASIRRRLGVECMEAAHAKTFGELEAMVGRGPGLDPSARPSGPAPLAQVRAMSEELKAGGLLSFLRCGIDIESVEMLPETNDYLAHEFYRDSFTEEEIGYCARQAHPRVHFAARWCVKEALKKCDARFMAEKMSRLEVVRADSGRLRLRHHGPTGARDLPHSVSASHSGTVAAAVVVAGPAAWVMRWSWLLLIVGLAAAVVAALALLRRLG
ncbi:MAG: 4'-phosphopantetheinyl transferase superfamily protein [Elusimicrobia bacterium]|nr:4'-phosphopantetheinyl transferase superfamily protein [Elusimicrobiota bacterium]